MKKSYKSVKSYKKDVVSEGENGELIFGDEYILSSSEFDKENNSLKEKTYNTEGGEEQVYVYKFNDDDKLIEELLYDDSGELASRKTFDYDDEKRLVKEIQYYTEEEYDIINYKYNSKGLLIEKTTVDMEGNIDNEQLFEYDDKSQLILEAVFDGDKKKFSEVKYAFDEAGRVIEKIEWDSDNNTHIKTCSSYDENNLLVKNLVYSKDKLIERYVYDFDANTKLIRVISEDASRKDRLELTYNDKGQLVEETEYNSEDEINHKIVRELDDNNEIIKSRISLKTKDNMNTIQYEIRYEYEL